MIATWTFQYPLYLDVARPDAPLLNGLSSSPLQQAITWVQSDAFPLRLHFRKRGAIQSASIPVKLDEALSITLGGRRRLNGQISGPLLVVSTSWTPGESETDAWYDTSLNLHTAELDALVESVNGPVTLQIDIEVGERLTFVVPVTIIPEAYKGEADPPPTLGGPGYALRSASIDWQVAEWLDVPIPDPMLVEEIILTADVEPTGAVYSLGTPMHAEAVDNMASMSTLVLGYSVNEIVTGGVLRLKRVDPSSVPATGHLIVKGVKL